jgi:small nuclear ribonucleoprotein G
MLTVPVFCSLSSRYIDKQLAIKLNGSRNVTGVLRGFDQFMNLVLEDTVEVVSATERNQIGMCVLRGNSVLMIECLEKL